jgi:hypothetical protein
MFSIDDGDDADAFRLMVWCRKELIRRVKTTVLGRE